MLSSLHIRNYVLIDSLDVSFPGGLSIITGQTGAGKSILLGALQLLLGAKADSSVLASGADDCVVEGEFSLPDDSLRGFLEDSGVEWAEDRSLVIRRVVYASGRSRSFMNDSPVNVGVLSECASHLLDIHSQNNNLILTDKRFQLSVLDHFAGNAELLAQCGECWRELQGLVSRKGEVQRRLEALTADRSYNEAQWKQLDAARLQEGELEALDTEQKQLANAESIREALGGAVSCFEAEEGMSLDSSLKEAGRLLDKISSYLPGMGELSDRIRSARIELDDIRGSLETAASKVEVSEDRLQAVEDRMGLIYGLLQKHGCRTEEELIALREKYSSMLFDSASLEEELAELEKRIVNVKERHSELCKALHVARAKAAPSFAERIAGSLKFLELDRAVFEVQLTPSEPGSTGSDGVLFAFSSTGSHPSDVGNCASGGEISRIMLCLKAMMARYVGMPTMIFDEIDTGVSGSAADRMGSMICDMGKDMQVIAITHLPQVAAKGDAHFVVEKTADVSSIRRVQGRDRVMEIARLLSGASITPEAVANAESLLG